MERWRITPWALFVLVSLRLLIGRIFKLFALWLGLIDSFSTPPSFALLLEGSPKAAFAPALDFLSMQVAV